MCTFINVKNRMCPLLKYVNLCNFRKNKKAKQSIKTFLYEKTLTAIIKGTTTT